MINLTGVLSNVGSILDRTNYSGFSDPVIKNNYGYQNNMSEFLSKIQLDDKYLQQKLSSYKIGNVSAALDLQKILVERSIDFQVASKVAGSITKSIDTLVSKS